MQRVAPAYQRLTRQTIHQVNIERGEACRPDSIQCLHNLGGALRTPHSPYLVLVETLYTNAHPVGAPRAKHAQPNRISRAR